MFHNFHLLSSPARPARVDETLTRRGIDHEGPCVIQSTPEAPRNRESFV
jgi:hypothetical protein